MSRMQVKSSILDALAATTVFGLFWIKFKAALLLVSISPEWIPAVGAICAAVAGAAFGRLLDWSKEYYLQRRRRKKIKRTQPSDDS